MDTTQTTLIVSWNLGFKSTKSNTKLSKTEKMKKQEKTRDHLRHQVLQLYKSTKKIVKINVIVTLSDLNQQHPHSYSLPLKFSQARSKTVKVGLVFTILFNISTFQQKIRAKFWKQNKKERMTARLTCPPAQ